MNTYHYKVYEFGPGDYRIKYRRIWSMWPFYTKFGTLHFNRDGGSDFIWSGFKDEFAALANLMDYLRGENKKAAGPTIVRTGTIPIS